MLCPRTVSAMPRVLPRMVSASERNVHPTTRYMLNSTRFAATFVSLMLIADHSVFAQNVQTVYARYGPTDLTLPVRSNPAGIADFFVGAVSVPRFNPVFGDLRRVDISFTASTSMRYSGTVSGLSQTQFSNVNAQFRANFEVDPQGPGDISVGQMFFFGNALATGFNPSVNISAPTQMRQSGVLSTGPGGYVGGGQQAIPYSILFTQTISSSNGPCVGSFTARNVTIDVQVDYVYDLGVTTCSGVLNSTGLDARLVAQGSNRVIDADVRLIASGLPLNTFVLLR
jgi:hypothetical protein